MKLATVITLSASITGCALTPPNFSETPTADLCMTYLSYPSNIWRNHRAAELARRNEDCTRYAALAAAQVQANAATGALGMQLLQMGQQNTPMIQTNCATYGNMTNCTTR